MTSSLAQRIFAADALWIVVTDGSAGTTETVYEPSFREALWTLETAFDRGAVVSVFGVCSVEYEGRAASSLALGARLLLLKPDGAALVHTDEKRKPVNWQPPGATHDATLQTDQLVIESTRTSPDESLTVTFETVTRVTIYAISGERSTDVRGTEEALRQRILSNPDVIEEEFDPRATEYQTDAGPVDVYGYDQAGTPVILELKRRRVGPDAVGQLARYVTALEDSPRYDAVRGILVSPSVTDTAAELLVEKDLEHMAVSPPESTPTNVSRNTSLTDWS